jgi:hypothetical protein
MPPFLVAKNLKPYLSIELVAATNPMAKDLMRVYDAVAAGCYTSDQCSAFTGLPLGTCSAYLGELVKCGLILVTHKRALRRPGVRNCGHPMHRYGLAKELGSTAALSR